MNEPKNILLLAGLDPSGGAGLLADIEVARSRSVRPFAVATALTGQNSYGVSFSEPTPPGQIEAQLRPLLDDFEIHAIKIGMLGTEANVRCVARLLAPIAAKVPIVLDPVICSSSGHVLLEESGQDALLRELSPMCQLVTPNTDELLALARRISTVASTKEAAAVLLTRASAVLHKGGHERGTESIDSLWRRGASDAIRFSAPRVLVPMDSNVRGTGCRLSSGIASNLALGDALEDAIRASKEALAKQLQSGFVRLGKGPALFL
jgi:hydroxymethylpyrimidine/phosphomethylpyrimidine kinase